MKILGFIILAALIIIIGFYLYAQYRMRNMKDKKNLEEVIDKHAQELLDKKKVPGFAIAVVKGDRYYIKGFGFSDIERNIPVDTNSIFEIGSISKVFTTELTEILVRKNIISWNDNIMKFIPEDYKPEKDDSTTLLHLATHTSGYPRIPDTFINKIKDECNPYSWLTKEDLLEYIKNPSQKKAPDTKISDYSNLGNGLLGHILEWKTGKTLEELMRTEIWNVLNMNSTTFSVKDDEHRVQAYDTSLKKTCHWDFPILYSCGAIKSSIKDMLSFLRANIDQSSLNEVFKSTHLEIYKHPDMGTAKGWFVDRITNLILPVGYIVWHNGGTGGFSSYLGILPDDKVGVVVLCNRAEANNEIEHFAHKLLLFGKKISFSENKK